LYETRHFERVVSLLTRTEAAAKHLTDYLRRTDPYGKTIVFCVDSEHAEQMRMALNNAAPDLARQHPDYVVRIVSDEGDVGRVHLSNFIDPERDTPVIATTSKLLSTGVDAPTVRNVVLFKPIGSIVEFKQIIGRGTRLFPTRTSCPSRSSTTRGRHSCSRIPSSMVLQRTSRSTRLTTRATS
jgi:type I restriction enzyme R subunit